MGYIWIKKGMVGNVIPGIGDDVSELVKEFGTEVRDSLLKDNRIKFVPEKPVLKLEPTPEPEPVKKKKVKKGKGK